jgi:hypothetical protein
MADSRSDEYCVCGEKMVKLLTMPYISGTRDAFGIGNEFVDESTGETIDTWGKWEKAGYRDARESAKDGVREGAKRKIDKIKHDKGKRFTVGG